MGNGCTHSNRSLIKVLGREYGYLCYSEFCDYRCKNCNTDGYASIIRLEEVYFSYNNAILYRLNHSDEKMLRCDHATFFVDPHSIKIEFSDELCEGDINLRSCSHISCNMATAECGRCQAKIQVKCGYKEDCLGKYVPSGNWKIVSRKSGKKTK